jgi:hypothetical protein
VSGGACIRVLAGGAAALLAAACIQSQDFPAPEAPAGPAADQGSLPPPACGSLDDPQNCGACGHSCLGGACARGQCQPVVLAEDQPTTQDSLSDAMAVDDSHVFWLSGGRIARVPTAGGKVDELRARSAARGKMRVVGDFIYLSTFDAVVRLPKNGGTLETVTPALPGVSTLQTFDVVDGAVAWIALRQDSNEISIQRLFFCSLPCTQPEEPWGDDGAIPGEIGRSASNLYATYAYMEDDPEGRQGAGVDSLMASYKSALVTNPFNELVIEEMPEEAFAYGVGMGSVARARLPRERPDGNQPYVPDKVLASDPELWPSSLALVDNDLYWIDIRRETGTSVFRVDKRGIALPEEILSGWRPVKLTATRDAIYFTTADGKVAKLARPLPVVAKTPDAQK